MKTQLLALLLVSACTAFSQKAKVTQGEDIKKSKHGHIEGQFTINGKPYVLVGDVKGIILDYSAEFYPVEEDFTLGKPIKQKYVNIIDGFMALKKYIYLEKIIVNKGVTYVFFTKRVGKRGTVYVQELDEGCQISIDNAEKVMSLDLRKLNKLTRFTVRQSPDGSKILVASMYKKTEKKSTYTFKVYDGEMRKVLWQKKFTAPACLEGSFSGGNRFNTGINQKYNDNNLFLINNEGRAFFLSNITNKSDTKVDYSFMSFDENGENQNHTEIKEPGNWMGDMHFMLNKKGNAELYYFYSAHDGKTVVSLGTNNPLTINSLQILEYDGKTINTKMDHEFTNDEMALMYPAVRRTKGNNYRLTGFVMSSIFVNDTGETTLVLTKSSSKVGAEIPFDETKYGYSTVLVLTKDYEFLTAHSFIKANGYGSFSCQLNGKTTLLIRNRDDEIQMIEFKNNADYTITTMGTFSKKHYAALGYSLFHEGRFIFPILYKRKHFSFGSAYLK